MPDHQTAVSVASADVVDVPSGRSETAPLPVPPPPPSTRQRVFYRAKRAVARLRWATVRQVRHGEIEISRLRGGWRAYGLDDGQVRCFVAPDTLTLQLPDAAALVRLSASGVLHGRVRRLRIRLTAAPDWLLAGIRPPRIGRNVAAFSWRRRSGGVEVRFVWSRQRDLDRALQDALSAVLRARPWDQASGPVYALDRTAWTAGASSWPQGLLATAPPQPEPDALGRPLGPFLAPEPPGVAASTAPVVTAVANPFGRILLGTATPYRLVTEGRGLTLRAAGGELAARLDPAHGAEAGLSGAELRKFAVVQVDAVPDGRFAGEAIRAMSACGMVFAAADPAVRTDLRHSGAVTVADAAEVSDLAGYGLSVAASRRAAIAGDAALRRTPLAGGDLPLPAVSVVLSSMRADDVETCLGYLAAQTYPAFEIVLGLHGYDVPAAVRERWAALVPVPLEVVSVPAAVPFGMVLGQLTRRSSGDLITKVDDDDHYGPHHLTDLVIAAHTSGADLTAKGARFVHFPELETTIDRAWAAPEVFNVTPAGGTMLLSRSTLAQIGGWSHSSKHVDADLLKRIRAAGGLVYRTHALEYVYVRRTAGHTFVAEIETLAAQGERSYPGLPEALIRPAYPAVD